MKHCSAPRIMDKQGMKYHCSGARCTDSKIITIVWQRICYNVITSKVHASLRNLLDMGKISTISARIDPEIKNGAERVFRELGFTSSQAITLFYKQVEFQLGLRFIVRIPNGLTMEAVEINTPKAVYNQNPL